MRVQIRASPRVHSKSDCTDLSFSARLTADEIGAVAANANCNSAVSILRSGSRRYTDAPLRNTQCASCSVQLNETDPPRYNPAPFSVQLHQPQLDLAAYR